jgi:hypothetical protein
MADVRLALLSALVALVALVLSSSAAASGPVRATMTTTSASPLVDTPWRYTISANDASGRALRATVRLQILHGALVVGCWKRTTIVRCRGANAGTWIPFRGTHSGVIRWPERAVGEKLVFLATVVAGDRSLRLRAPVRVRLP